MKSFWQTIEKPIVALSPMDGVTDAAFRYMTDVHGKPSILFTEFTNVEGIVSGAVRLLYAFVHHKSSTPTVAQIFGITPEAFYKVAFILGEMGFDGIDINMGCPDQHIAKKGGGAGLILRPKEAQQIILETKRGITQWAEGKTMAQVGLKPEIIEFVERFQNEYGITPEKRALPVSVKTRMGYEDIVTEDWIKTLLEVEPANISLHGRTLKQMYTGTANWEEIAKAAVIVKQTDTTFLGNGDVQNYADAKEKTTTYGTDGVLIGRAALGNPWVFSDTLPTALNRLDAAVEHSKKFEEMTPQIHFLAVRKHLGWYCKGFDYAAETRVKLMQTNTASDVETIVRQTKLVLSA